MSLLVTLSIGFTSQAADPALNQSGLYRVQGSHPQYGSYTGQAQVEGSQVTRLIRYRDLRWNGLEVEQVWQGTLHKESLFFALQRPVAIVQYNGHRQCKKASIP